MPDWVPDWLLVVLVIVGLLLLVLGLAYLDRPTHEPVTAFDGAPAVLVTASSPGEVAKEMANACPRGWTVVSRGEKRGETSIPVQVGTVPMVQTYETFSTAMVIRCR